MPRRSLDADQVRAVRILAQGFPVPRTAKLGAQLAASGWQRTLGGADAYLAARARMPKLRRGDLDSLVVERELCVVPAVRGCIYLVPRADLPLCLSVARELSQARDERDAERAGIRPKELDELGKAVLAELKGGGPRTTDGIRKALAPGSVRSLGEKGKKVGVSSTLPPTLRRLEFAGRIARTPVDGHLDHEKYLWCATDTDPFADADLPDDPGKRNARLLQFFVERAGVTTMQLFCDWAGFTQRDGKQALEHCKLERVTAAGLGNEALATPALPTMLRKLDKAAEPIAFLPFEDNLIHLAGGLASVVVESAQDLQVPAWGDMKSKKTTAALATTKHVMFRSILAEGRVRGFWEYDPDDHTVATHLFDPPAKAVRAAIDEEADDLARFLHDELGHGHSFSLDSDDELRRRLALLRKMRC